MSLPPRQAAYAGYLDAAKCLLRLGATGLERLPSGLTARQVGGASSNPELSLLFSKLGTFLGRYKVS